VRRTDLIEKLITLANAANMSLMAAIMAATSLCAARRGRSVRPSPPTTRRLRAVLNAFDLRELNGEDLRLPPFEKRGAKLARLLACINFGIALSGHTEALADGLGGYGGRGVPHTHKSAAPSRELHHAKNRVPRNAPNSSGPSMIRV
jgi:hypothetical protein